MLLAVLLSGCHHGGQQQRSTAPYASRSGLTITLHPSAITFRVPQQWLEWNDQFHNNFHLSREELKSVEQGGG
jgi:hypothetical protein